MAKKSVPASINETAFDCPHCGAYTTQTWFDLYTKALSGDSRTPHLSTSEFLERVRTDKVIPAELRRDLLPRIERELSGLVVFRDIEGEYVRTIANNLHLSRCFNCHEVAVWIYDRLLFPPANTAPAPNEDLPASVRADYDEAGRILDLSPRGAAALLRLGIQKLCIELGEEGKKIDDDIASLVKKGLPLVIQQALDAVRVVGNEAVHPGTLNLKDDRDTATKLFRLVNIIAEQMISNPKHVAEVYGKLPEAKRKAIEKRDGPVA